MAQQNLFNAASKFFRKLGNSPEGAAELKRYNRRIQFIVQDDEPFFLNIKSGKISIKQGFAEATVPESVKFQARRSGLLALFEGKLRFSDAFFTPPSPELRIRLVGGSPGGTFGGTVSVWVGKMVRIGQEIG